jgi:two-component system LytT family response regulator
MRVLIVDDERPARDLLRRLLVPHADAVQVVGEAADGFEALAMVDQHQPDALFVDIQMPEVSGLDLAASLPDPGPAVVFVTAFDRYALQAFDAQAVDYLLKPVDPARLARAVERLRRRVVPTETPALPKVTQLLIPDRGTLHVVPVGQIRWLQSADNYVTVYGAERPLLMRRTLSGLLADLGERFVRVHRTAAVAVEQVAEVQRRDTGDATVRLRDGTEVPCSRAHRDALLARLQG